MNRSALIGAAQSIAARLAQSYSPPEPALLQVAGPSGKAGLMVEINARAAAGGLTETDVALAEILAEVLTGGPSADPTRPASEEDIMALERAALRPHRPHDGNRKALAELAGEPWKHGCRMTLPKHRL
jgi:3-hydroxyacyl-CoA dehydrogenase